MNIVRIVAIIIAVSTVSACGGTAALKQDAINRAQAAQNVVSIDRDTRFNEDADTVNRTNYGMKEEKPGVKDYRGAILDFALSTTYYVVKDDSMKVQNALAEKEAAAAAKRNAR